MTPYNVVQALSGKDPRVGRDFSNFVRRSFPGSTLPLLRAPMDRLVFDQLQQFLDPDAADAFRQQARRQLRVKGNESFYDRGDLLPSRAPDFSGIFGG